MRIIGIRNSPAKIRFCILEGDKSGFVFTNYNGENKIDLPKSIKTEAEVYSWAKCEFARIFDKYGPFDHLAIKQNENVPSRYSSLKLVMFLDCIATIVAIENNTAFSSHVYTNLGTNSKNVVTHIETVTNRTITNWDAQIADAIAASIINFK